MKTYTFPTLYDNALQIDIKKLKNWGYLNPEQIKSGTLNWSRNGNPNGSISIVVNTKCEQPYIELDYKYRFEPRKYKVFLVKKPSNLQKGEIWFFVCPHTNKLCRILYSIRGYFYHREAFKGCMYETQTRSKKYIELDKNYGAYFKLDNIYFELLKKNFKRTYAGKPTKKYLCLMNLKQKAENTPIDLLEKEMVSVKRRKTFK